MLRPCKDFLVLTIQSRRAAVRSSGGRPMRRGMPEGTRACTTPERLAPARRGIRCADTANDVRKTGSTALSFSSEPASRKRGIDGPMSPKAPRLRENAVVPVYEDPEDFLPTSSSREISKASAMLRSVWIDGLGVTPFSTFK